MLMLLFSGDRENNNNPDIGKESFRTGEEGILNRNFADPFPLLILHLQHLAHATLYYTGGP
jgi:hypothetical protein